MVEERKILWLPKAKEELKDIIKYIKKDSPQNAEKVKKEVLDQISSLTKYPENFPPDKYKLANTNNAYRAFEIHRIRISYYLSEKFIMIIRVRHTKQEPLQY